MSRVTSWLESYIKVAFALLFIWFAILGYWAVDRSSPFQLKDYTVFNAGRGQTMFIDADVQRDTARACAVTFSRYLFDSKLIRHELGGGQYMSAAALKDMDATLPGRLRLAIQVPPGAALGPASLITALEYNCNPVHTVWPIEVLMKMNVEVLP